MYPTQTEAIDACLDSGKWLIKVPFQSALSQVM